MTEVFDDDGVSSEQYVGMERIISDRNNARKKDALFGLISYEEGRELIHDILSLCGVYQAPPSSQTDMIRAVGRQDVGREILEKVFTSDAAAYSLMLQEHARRAEADQQELDTMVKDLSREMQDDD